MKKPTKWFRILAVVPLLALLTGVNYYEDPANLFHAPSPGVAQAIMDGNAVYYGSANADHRGVKTCMIELMPDHVDCLTIGSSVAMGIRRENVGTDSYYNLSVSNLGFYDTMAEFALLELNGVEYDRVILYADTYFFDEINAGEILNEDLRPYADYMIARIEGNDAPIPDPGFGITSFSNRAQQLFSVTYFQSSVDYIQENGSLLLKTERWGIVDDSTQELAHYMSDGSWVYSADYQQNDSDYVHREAVQYDYPLVFSADRHISEYHKEHFRMLVQYLLERGVTVELFIAPVCPSMWDIIQSEADHYPMVNEIEQFENEIASEYGLRVVGTFNPYDLGLTDSDFMDSRHMRHDRLQDFFDFT